MNLFCYTFTGFTPQPIIRFCLAARRLRFFFLTVLGVMLASSPCAHAQYRVLFIGNSFTIGSGGGGVPGIFDRLAQAGGHPDPTTVMRAVGGQDFQFHTQDSASQAAITYNQWTHVVLQNYSTEPTHLASGSVADHYAYGSLLYRQVMTNNPNTRVILFETWSRSASHSLITGVSSPASFASTTEFQNELRDSYHGLADTLNVAFPSNPPVIVGPVGTAWENAGGLREPSDPLFVPLFGTDNYHGNNNGYYLAACVFYSLIYGVSPHGLSTNALITGLNLGLTVSPGFLENMAWSTVSSASQTGVQAFLFDFGVASAITTNGTVPADPDNHWNNITEAIGGSSLGQLSNLVTTLNSTTDIGLTMISRFNGANQNGTTSSAILPMNATRDSLFGNTEVFDGQSDIFPSFKLTRLNRTRTYTFTFYASRTGVADNREASYTVTGQNSGSAVLDAANNQEATTMVPAIVPDASGEITIRLAPGTNNNSPNHFTYLNAMRVDAVPQQEPIAFVRHPEDQNVYERQSATFTAAVQGTPPYFIQWLSNGVPVANANSFIYTIPSVTTNMNGAIFVVSVSNLAYSATSSAAVLHVLPAQQNPFSKSLFFDFGGSSTTSMGPSPDDPLNQWNNVTTAVGASSIGSLTNLVTGENGATTIGLVMLSRFNGANDNGTTASPWLPPDATRDSLFGNTESFSGLANVFPKFKFTGLDPTAKYNLTFFASRTGVGDNRETGYTVTGANSGFGALDAANNLTNSVMVTGIVPNAAREIIIAVGPAPKNNNANHFTYLGVLRLDPVLPPPVFAPVLRTGNQIKLDWTGSAQLQWAPGISGPWTSVTPPPTQPHLETIIPGEDRFYRLIQP